MLQKISMTEAQLRDASGVLETEFSTKGLDDTDMFWLCSIISGPTASGSMITLNFEFNNFGDNGMEAFADAVATGKLSQLVSLNMRKNNIGDDGFIAFANAMVISPLSNNRAFAFQGNSIGDAGIVAFAGAASSMTSGKFFTFQDNAIGDTGYAAFASAFDDGHFPEIKQLNVVRNVPTQTGIDTLTVAGTATPHPGLVVGSSLKLGS